MADRSTDRFTPWDLLVFPVAMVMGCPCCGPEWYRALLRFVDDRAGREYYREYDNRG